jgi:PKD repeat protein
MTGRIHPVTKRYGIFLAGLLIMALVLVPPAAAAWNTMTVDSNGFVGAFTSLALDSSGHPHISYYEFMNGDLKYAAWNGTSWTITTVDSSGDVGGYTSLALNASGYPCISYYDYTNGDLKYAAWNGTSWAITTVDSSGNVGAYTSLALDPSGHPHISYCDETNKDLKYAAWNGDNWNTQTVDSGGYVGWYSSIALNGDIPYISYYDYTNGDLKYARNGGSSLWSVETVDSSGNVGMSSSLAVDTEGGAYISYYDYTNGDLKYAVLSPLWGTWTNTTVDSSGDVTERFTSLKLASSGYPRISYYDYTNGDLKYAAWNGTSWAITTVDSSGDVGSYSSLALDSSGNPRISYTDFTNRDLKFAMPALVTDISATTVSGHAPLTVTFTGTATNTLSSPKWGWVFGDGGSSFEQNPTYTYSTPGTYTVCLAAYDAAGLNISTRVGYITVTQGLTTAGFTGTPATGTAPLTVQFVDTSTNNPDSWSWDFGDGITTNATKQNPVHTYTAGGNYTVRLTAARDGVPDTLTRTAYISVSPSYFMSQPVITAVTPVSGARNQTVPFTVTGKNFQPGFTTVEFRNKSTGIITANLGTVTPTSINGTITIPANASAGDWNLRVATTSGGDAVALKKLTVTSLSAPAITSITPATGARNATVTYTIVGTNFEPGLTNVTFKNATGYVLNGTVLTSVTATRITGTIMIPPTAWTGAYNVNISTVDGGSVPGTGKFTVAKYPAPAISSITPASGPRNAEIAYTIAGTNFEPGLTTVIFRNATGFALAGTTLTSVTPTRINGTITVPADALIGAYNVNVSTVDGGSVPGTGLFSVTKKAPAITAVTPASAPRNTTVAFSIAGSNFEPGTTTVVFRNASGTVLAVPAISSVTATRISGTITVPADALIGAYNVNVSTVDGGSVPGTGLFSVTKTAPAITAVAPASAWRNQTVSFTITGTNFEPNTTTVMIRNASGSAVNETTLTSVTTTRITGIVMVPPNAWIGAYNVNISTQYGGSTPGTGKFAVAKFPAATISSMTPGTIYRGTTVGYAIAGTNFEPGLTSVWLNQTGHGDMMVPVDSGNSTLLRGSLTVPSFVTNGSWNIIVSTADGGTVVKGAVVTLL